MWCHQVSIPYLRITAHIKYNVPSEHLILHPNLFSYLCSMQMCEMSCYWIGNIVQFNMVSCIRCHLKQDSRLSKHTTTYRTAATRTLLDNLATHGCIPVTRNQRVRLVVKEVGASFIIERVALVTLYWLSLVWSALDCKC